MLTSAKHMDTIYEERECHWSQQLSAMATTRTPLQHDQTHPLSAKGVACKTTNNHLSELLGATPTEISLENTILTL